MPEARPRTPARVARTLRREACFGCCVCGGPIFEYHHILPYAREAHFRPEDMMVLCPNHHAEANALVLDESEQRDRKANPFNCERGFAAGQLALKQRSTEIDLGGHCFVADAGEVIRVDGDVLMAIDLSATGSLLVTLRLFDHEDNLVAEVVENEWISHDPLPWDIEFRYRELKIRNAPRNIALTIDCRDEPVAIRGHLWRKGRLLEIDDHGLHVDDAHLVGSGKIVGAAIELDASEGATGFRLVPQQPGPKTSVRRASPKVGRNDPCPCGSGRKFKRCHGRP